MNFKTIKWEQHPDFPDNHKGLIGDQEVFTIVNIGKKDLMFELKSWCLKSNTFHTSATPKKIGEYKTLILAQYEANLKWDEFINLLLENEEVELQHTVTNSEVMP